MNHKRDLSKCPPATGGPRLQCLIHSDAEIFHVPKAFTAIEIWNLYDLSQFEIKLALIGVRKVLLFTNLHLLMTYSNLFGYSTQ